MLERSDLIIKIFIALYLVSICVYICVSWICTYMVAHIYFHVFLVIFGIDYDYVILFIYHNKVKKGGLNIFSIAPCVRLLYHYKTDSLHGLLNGFTDLYMYVHMYCWEKIPPCVTVRFCNFRDKWLGHGTLTFIQ